MGRRVVWMLGAALGVVLLTTPATAQVHVGVGVAVPGVSASVVYGAPPVYYPPPYAAYPVPYPYAYPYYAPPYYYRYPVYGPKYYRGRPGYYYGKGARYYPDYRRPRYSSNYVPDYYRGVGAMGYRSDTRYVNRSYGSNVRYGRSNGRR